MRTAAARAVSALARRRAGDDGIFARCLAASAAPPPPASGSGDEDGGPDRPCTPWVRTVVSGVDLMRNPK